MLPFALDNLMRLPSIEPGAPDRLAARRPPSDPFNDYLQRARTQPAEDRRSDTQPPPAGTDRPSSAGSSPFPGRDPSDRSSAADEGADRTEGAGPGSAEPAKDTASPPSPPAAKDPSSGNSQGGEQQDDSEAGNSESGDPNTHETSKDEDTVAVETQGLAGALAAPATLAMAEQGTESEAGSVLQEAPVRPHAAVAADGAQLGLEQNAPAPSGAGSTDEAGIAGPAGAQPGVLVSSAADASLKANGESSGKPAMSTAAEKLGNPSDGTPGDARSENAESDPFGSAQSPTGENWMEPGARPVAAQNAQAEPARRTQRAENRDAVDTRSRQAAAETAAPSDLTSTAMAPADPSAASGDRPRELVHAVAQNTDSDAKNSPPDPAGHAVDGSPRPAPAQGAPTGDAEQGQNGSEVNLADRVRLVRRVERAFQSMSDHGGSVRLRLSPPELGALRIEITVRNGEMTARMEAETPAARSLLLDNLPALRDRLAQQDIKIQHFDVDLMDRPFGGSPDQTPQFTGSSYRGDGGGGYHNRGHASEARDATPPANPAPARRLGDAGTLNVII